MAWPYTTAWDFDNGSVTEIGTETDGSGILTPESYRALSRRGYAPYIGGYAVRVTYPPAGATSTGIIADADVSILSTETAYFGFALYVDSDFDPGATVYLLQGLNSTTTEFGFALDAQATFKFVSFMRNAGGEQFDTGSTVEVPRDEWVWIDVEVHVDTAATNGYITAYMTRQGASAVQITSKTGVQTAAAVDNATFGAVRVGGAGATGTFLLDSYRYHDPADAAAARIKPVFGNWRKDFLIDVPRHAFVGPGKLEEIRLTTGSDTTVNSIRVYDTDSADTSPGNLVLEMKSGIANEVVRYDGPEIYFQRGCYVDILDSGTTIAGASAATSSYVTVSVDPRIYGSRGNVIRYGRERG